MSAAELLEALKSEQRRVARLRRALDGIARALLAEAHVLRSAADRAIQNDRRYLRRQRKWSGS